MICHYPVKLMLASLKYSLQCLTLTVCTTLLNREEEGSGVWIQSGISVKNKIQISYGKCFASRCATSADLANTGDLAHSKHRMQKCHEQLQIIRGVGGGGRGWGGTIEPPFWQVSKHYSFHARLTFMQLPCSSSELCFCLSPPLQITHTGGQPLPILLVASAIAMP